MKNFYPAIVLSDGEIIHNPFASSHQELIDWCDRKCENYLKVRYRPEDLNYGRLDDVDNYILTFEQNSIPEWFTPEMNKETLVKLHGIISGMIIRKRRKLILNEGVILAKNASVNLTKNCKVFGMYDDSKIQNLGEGTEVCMMTDRTFINEMFDNSIILEMFDWSKVTYMRGNAVIRKMYANSKVIKMKGSARVDYTKGYSSVDVMDQNAFLYSMRQMSVVEQMYGHSSIDEMWDWAVVGSMHDDANINYMDDDTKVQSMHGHASINEMYGNAIIEKSYGNTMIKKLNEKAKILQKRLKEEK